MTLRLLPLLLTCIAVPALAGPPTCTPELKGVIWEFGTAASSDLRQCDGAQYVAWVPPLSACPPPLPPVAPPPVAAPPPPPTGASPPPLPTGPAIVPTQSKADCESTCRGLFHRCVTTKCGGLGGQCKQDCARSQARCNTSCPAQ
ncbi:MAG: hypothetical protein JNJ54_00275 [Myxococcaceae bacterium]|nr:hypothetical protein [Myxococcaceae bacterium]